MAMKSLNVHDFEAHGLATDVARLEAFGFGDLVRDDVDAYSGERDRSFRSIVTAAQELMLRG
jgi:hypothetical protein